jgi:hypothetical protein
MNTNRSFFGIACRVAAFSFLMAGTASLIEAQQSSSVVPAPRAPLFLASESTPLDLTGTSSSSSSSSDATPSYAKLDLDSAALGSSQPPPRRTYGRPNYSGGNTNPDGSAKYFGLGGFGLAMPIGNTHKYETLSWGFQAGVGRNFNKTLGVALQFDYDHFGLQGATLNNEDYIYNYCTIAEYSDGLCTPEGPASSGNAAQIDGNNHVWSFTLNPTFTIPTEGSLGAYVVVGGGYYHKVTNFTTPTEECDYYYGCGVYNETFDHYTSNAFGVNGGFGLTYKFSRFSNERFYVEARYVLMLNSQRTGVTTANVATSPLNATDYYPANSDRTTYIPIKVGIRF